MRTLVRRSAAQEWETAHRAALWAAALMLLAALPHLTAAQEPLAESFDETIDVTEVLLDVLVTDRRGNVVLGLSPADFEVTEGGEPVEIESVSFYSSRRPESPLEALERSGTPIDTVPADRYLIFFFQDVRRHAASIGDLTRRQSTAGRDARRWVEGEMAPGDRAAVVGHGYRLHVYQDFTSDRRALARAMQDAAHGRRGNSDWPSRRQEPGAVDGPSLLAHLPAGDDLGRATRTIYRALERLALAAAEARGRKILLFFGTGFGELDRSGRWQPDLRHHADTMNALNDANIAVYALDLTPVEVRHSFERALRNLALSTGGAFFGFSPSFLAPLRTIDRINGGYYLLSYRSPRPRGERGFQRVKVSVANKELRVTARQGYLWGEDPPEEDGARAVAPRR